MKHTDWEGVKAYVLGRLLNELSPRLTYHSIRHTRDDVLPAAVRLARLTGLNPDDTLLLKTAALFHDIGFIEQYTQNEQIAVRIAQENLPRFGYKSAQIQRIGEIILATQLPQTPNDFIQELICDADLDSLGRDDFSQTSQALMKELNAYGSNYSEVEWYRIQLNFLLSHKYFTEVSRTLRQKGKQNNIALFRKLLKTHLL